MAVLVSAAAVALLAATMPLSAAAQTEPSDGPPPPSTPVSASESPVDAAAAESDGAASEDVQGAQSPGIFQNFSFVYLGRPGSVQAGYDRYYLMTAAGLGVTTACTGSTDPPGHCTWAEYYWSRTSTSGGSYLTGDNVPMYFDFNSRTVWLIFSADAPVLSGNWSGSQAGGSATVAVTCAVHAEFRTDDWPPSEVHDDVWHNVKVCQGSLADMLETGGSASIPVAPDDFDVRVLPGSDPISRAGHYTELALELSKPTGAFIRRGNAEPIPVVAPVANAPVAGSVAHGPSAGTQIMCQVTPSNDVPDPGYSNVCMTDADGHVMVRYLVPSNAAHALQRGQDTLRVFIDQDGDGTHDHKPGQVGHEPAASLDIDIAKRINYVALGDSYSSGEVGTVSPSGTFYQSGVSAADGHCRRWSETYGQTFASDVLGHDVTFAIFACTGAITLNVHDAADPSGLGTARDHLNTNRPSSAAPAKFRRPARPGTPAEVVTPADWEPRQAASLAGVQAMGAVDMVTVTIGGNDAGFGKVVNACVNVLSGAGCGESDLALDFDEVGRRVRAVLTQIKAVAPSASVFVLGYPYLTPTLDECRELSPQTVAVYEEARLREALTRIGVSQRCADVVVDYVKYIEGDDCQPLRANQIYHATPGLLGVATDLVGFIAGETLNIEASETVFLKNTADSLNAKIKEAAAAAGVHFVDVTPAESVSGASFDWGGHSACSSVPWMRGYVEDQEAPDGVNTGSFHPTAAGHQAYAQILERYIRDVVRSREAGLSNAGLPLNPTPEGGGIDGSSTAPSRSARGSASATGDGIASDRRGSADPGEAATAADETQSAASTGLLLVRRTAAGSGCGAGFVSAAEKVTLSADGFASGAAVTFSAAAASFGETTVTAPTIAAATADSDGVAEATLTVPAAPAASVDPAPRAYAARATGANPAGGTHTALMIEPLVAYPASAPCAIADTANTSRVTPVQIAVLANDTIPTGGSLDAASVAVRETLGGSFVVDSATGKVTFTPDAGFHGTVETSYVVYDKWGIGDRGEIAITVAPGCTITGTAGTVLIEGTAGNDVICVPDPNDYRTFHVIDGKGGDDVILGGAGVEWVYGGAGADVIWSHGGDDRIVAGTGTDTVHGGPGMDYVYSLDTADTIVDDDYELVLSPTVTVEQSGPVAEGDRAWAGESETVAVDVLANDHDPNGDLDPGSLRVTTAPTLGAALVSQTADGGRMVSYTAPAGSGSDSFTYEICDSLGNCVTASVQVTVGAVCAISGTEGDDVLWGTPGDDVICGLGGDDVIHGQGGNDVLIGGPGNDIVWGGQGNDVLVGGAGKDSASGGRGDDIVWGGDGDDIIWGDDGDDRIWGGDGHDNLSGNDGDDRISSGAGDDIVWGYDGDDRIWGGPGDDRIWGGFGDDTIWGGTGNDTLRAGIGDDVLWGGPGNDTLAGAAGTDTLHGGTGDDSLDGGDGTDVLWGGIGDDMLWGKNHNDQLHGGPGADTLRGGLGDDRLWGGPGHDSLNGNSGTDHLDGGEDTDTCARGSTTARCE